MRRGRITHSSSLGYEVYLESGEVIRAKRRKGRDTRDGLPMIGDLVEIDDSDQIVRFLPRTSVMERPRVANIDQVAVTISAKQPDFSSFLLDKYLTAAISSNIPAFIIVTKWDLLNPQEQATCRTRLAWYEKLGYRVFTMGRECEEELPALVEKVEGKISAFMGQTGVGKSSLSNEIDPEFKRPVGRFDEQMGRGMHQTKEVILIPFAHGFLADTPGFSDFRLTLDQSELAHDFPGFFNLAYACRFRDCLHRNEPGCAVSEAVANGLICPDSYQNYLKLLSEANAPRGWEKRSSHSSRPGKEK